MGTAWSTNLRIGGFPLIPQPKKSVMDRRLLFSVQKWFVIGEVPGGGSTNVGCRGDRNFLRKTGASVLKIQNDKIANDQEKTEI